MTGQLLHKLPADPERPHTHVVLSLDNGTELRYSDPRRFGRLLLGTEAELVAARKLPRLGPEPLDPLFTPRDLHRRLSGRRAPLKLLLLDQSILAGIGNIYADEALWRARVHPLREARSLEEGEVQALHRSIRRTLEHGIARQGSTLRDYALPDGGSGEMQHEFKVYGRTGEPCDRCGTPIEKIKVAGRGTWYCPACQPSPAYAASNSSSPPSRSSRRSSV